MVKAKWICMTGMTGLLCACTVPGTFINVNSAQDQYNVNNQQIYPTVIQLNAYWVAAHRSDLTYQYHVGPYDILNIIVWDHPELTTPTTQLANPEQSGFLVNADGTIYFPFAGQVNVNGLTMEQIQTRLQATLARYIRNPQVSVRVVSFRSQEIQVLGEVKTAGVIPLTDKRLTIWDAINLAGGLNNETANTKRIFVLRGTVKNLTVFWIDTTEPSSMMAAQYFILQKNDLVYVPPAGVSSWNRVISQLVPTTAGAAALGATVK